LKDGASVDLDTPNAIKLTWRNKKIDLVRKNYTNVNEIFSDFDFTVCMAAIDTSSKQFIYYQDYFIHLSTKKLVFDEENKIVYPISTLWRCQKYIQKGFTICMGGTLRLIMEIRALDLENIQVPIMFAGGDGRIDLSKWQGHSRTLEELMTFYPID
ncbi:MAG: hypothetical protein KC414_03100, partial [Romboutsia sp.]|nr:hypothetical protein [Romboutsia sp.]